MNPKIDERIKEEYEAKITGKFKIKIGNKTVAKGKNMWTRYFVSSLVQALYDSFAYVDCGRKYTKEIARLMSYSHTARVGTDTSTPSSPDMADLVSKIDIAPDTKAIVIFKELDYSEYRSRHKYLWNPGTIPAQTIGEFGVYLYLSDDSWNSPQENTQLYYINQVDLIVPYVNPALRLGARVSSGDGDFDPIDYDSSRALIFEWYVTIKF